MSDAMPTLSDEQIQRVARVMANIPEAAGRILRRMGLAVPGKP